MSMLPTNFLDLDPNHTPAHNNTNAQVNINSRPATTQVINHTVAGTLTIDGEDGFQVRVTMGANITGFSISNLVTGIPVRIIFEGHATNTYTVDLSSFESRDTVTLSSSVTIAATEVYELTFMKLNTGEFWSQNGLISWTNGADHLNTVGEIKIWPTGAAPHRHLLCDGSAVSRTTYADLFSLIGTTYGVGDGSTTFNLPDLGGVGQDPQIITSFTPELKADTADPTLGSSPIQIGFYRVQRGLLHMWGIIQFGSSGAAGGTGNYYIPLPAGFTVATGTTAQISTGTVQTTESAVGWTFGHTVTETANDAIRMYFDVGAIIGGPTVPFTWGNSDRIRFSAYVPIDSTSLDVANHVIRAF